MEGGVVCAVVPDTALATVQYPGNVRNVQAAIKTLGGESAIGNATAERSFLQLSFRPDEPLCHPIIGDYKPAKSLVLRISRRKGSNPDEPASCQVVGRVGSTFRFVGLADYQYVPLDTHYATRDYSNTPPTNLPEKAEPTGVAEPLLLLPPTFSRSDQPFDYGYRQHRTPAPAPPPGPAAGPPPAPPHGAMPDVSQPRDLPPEPGPSAREVQGHALLLAVAQLLEQRPVWTPLMLEQACGSHLLGVVLTGPWRGCLIRKGYDPRLTPSSKRYQAITYTLPDDWFQALPPHRTTLLQLCDLDDDRVRLVLAGPPSAAPWPPPRCSEASGWLTAAELAATSLPWRVWRRGWRQGRWWVRGRLMAVTLRGV
ncbi:RNA polymerase III transcription factor IIIC subunit-domain-containing protein [Haematococcus lacustris]